METSLSIQTSIGKSKKYFNTTADFVTIIRTSNMKEINMYEKPFVTKQFLTTIQILLLPVILSVVPSSIAANDNSTLLKNFREQIITTGIYKTAANNTWSKGRYIKP